MKNGSSKAELKQDIKMTKGMTAAQKSAYMKADKKMHAKELPNKKEIKIGASLRKKIITKKR
jgi:hypothetical protein